MLRFCCGSIILKHGAHDLKRTVAVQEVDVRAAKVAQNLNIKLMQISCCTKFKFHLTFVTILHIKLL